jgi:Domain of unknown function (DUF4926)
VKFEELDVVTLATDLPEDGLRAGATGTVVHIFHRPHTAYEVEFADSEGVTTAMVTLTAEQLRLATQ